MSLPGDRHPSSQRPGAGIALLLALALASSSAAAAPKSTADRQARALFDQGVALSDEGKWAEALTAFQKSDALVPSATVRYNLAATQRALGRYVEAKRTLEGILADPQQFRAPIKPRLREELEKLLSEVKGKIVVVSLLLSPPGADVQVDGAAAAPMPDGRLELDPGRHVFVIAAEGHETTTVTQALSASDTEVTLTAPRKRAVVPQPPPRPPAPFYTRAWFWATVGGVAATGVAVAITVALAQPDAAAASPPTRTVDRLIPTGVRF
jgi:tetratricopeptide (TPR) repeat protein